MKIAFNQYYENKGFDNCDSIKCLVEALEKHLDIQIIACGDYPNSKYEPFSDQRFKLTHIEIAKKYSK